MLKLFTKFQAITMDEYEQLVQLDAIKNSGPPMNAFLKVSQFINPEGYEINPMLLELLHAKKFAGDGTEDPTTI